MLNQVQRLLIGKAGGVANVGASLATITKGDILVMNMETGAVITGTSATIKNAPLLGFAVGVAAGEARISSPIEGKNIVSVGNAPYVAAVAHKMSIGYAGSGTDSIVVENSSRYAGAVTYHDELRLICNRDVRNNFEYTSSLSATGFEIAEGLMKSFNEQEFRYAIAKVQTNGAATGIAVTAEIARGTSTVVYAAAHGLVAGDYVRLGAYGDYQVESVDGLNVTLTSKFYSPSQAFASGDTSKLATVTLFGVSFTGIEIPTVTINKYEHVTFEMSLEEGFEDQEVHLNAQGNKGTGLGIQVKELEHACIGKLGVTDHTDFRTNKDIRYMADVDANYNVVSIRSEATVEGDLQQNRLMPVETTLAFDELADTQATAVLAIVNPWLASAGAGVLAV